MFAEVEPFMVPHCTPPGQQVPPTSLLPRIEPTAPSTARAENTIPWHQLNFTWAIMTEPLDKLQETRVLNVPKNTLMWCNADVPIWAGLSVFFFFKSLLFIVSAIICSISLCFSSCTIFFILILLSSIKWCQKTGRKYSFVISKQIYTLFSIVEVAPPIHFVIT